MNFPTGITIGSQQRDGQQSQNLNNVSSYRLPAASAQCVIGTEKNPDAAILLN